MSESEIKGSGEQFLKLKGIIKEGYSKWICRFEDGAQFNIGDMLEEYAALQNAKLTAELAAKNKEIAEFKDVMKDLVRVVYNPVTIARAKELLNL